MKRIRPAHFAPRSFLPTSAACVVANAVRETLTSLLGAPASMRICEPSIPAQRAWPAIVRDALLYRVRGSVADAALVIRAVDALALANGIFGEVGDVPEGPRVLSPIEREVVDRTANAIASNLGAICGGREAHRAERVESIASFVTYFELLLEEPVVARIGVALSRDPAPEPRGRLELAHLAGVEIPARASLALGSIEARAAAALIFGSTLPVSGAAFGRCAVTIHGRTLARGQCGVAGGRFCIRIDRPYDAHGEAR